MSGAIRPRSVPLRKGIGICSGLYRVPASALPRCAVLSNTPRRALPQRRAAEATFIIERLCDLADDQNRIDRIEIRRRNLIAPEGTAVS